MVAPFARFARHYDRFMMKFVDYPGWVNYVLKIFRRFKVVPRTILDVACGSGIPTVLLAQKGYRMIGVDRSREMLAVLESKRGNLPIELVCADIRDFKISEPVDAAISLYDSINYLLTEEDLERCFGCVFKSLVGQGIFVFDMNTVYGLSEGWGTRTITRETEEIVSIWQNSYDRQTKVSTLHLTFWEKMGDGTLGERYEEIHEERAYTVEEVRRALRAAGFSETHFYHHGGFLPVGPLTVRMMVVAQK
ncbi:MAG: class I SAM-dependent methyltransferase [candidate division WOR-3 bacterium]|jgi:SAM-dependent methyltransferase|nr:methyltransferase domain-containing protein [candidate division WOR-3 bacterium]MDH7519571.1 class I SAM-dependent methyltransferase [bacterium]